MEEVKATARSNNDKHEAVEWQLEVRLTKEKEERGTVEEDLAWVGCELQKVNRQGGGEEQLTQCRL